VPDIFAMLIKPGIDLADLRNWPAMGAKSLSGYQKKRFFHNEDGQRFTEQAARHGLDSTRDGRGVAVADFDNDGRLDLFVANANGPPHLYRNRMPPGPAWTELALQGTGRNTAAIGARVLVTAGGRTQLRFVAGGNGFAAQGSSRVHAGLAGARQIDRLDIRWPSGRRQVLVDLPVNQLHVVREGPSSSTAPSSR
jgi:hypothetical protein